MSDDELVTEFKKRWAEADRQGMEGHRVEYALMPIIERVKAEAKAEALEEAARELRDRAAVIRAAAENGEGNG
jgi:hypothetical protein